MQPSDAATSGLDGPLVWRQWLRALGWVRDWAIQQFPAVSSIPVLALCVFLYVMVEQPLLRWLLPAPLLWLSVSRWVNLVMPPT